MVINSKLKLLNAAHRSKNHIIDPRDNRTEIKNILTGISIRLFEDGSIIRGDIRLDLCKRMTIPEAAKALDL